MSRSLVFDLDGTLIDSSPGILSALSTSLLNLGYDSIHVDSTLLGPPLPSVFRKLLPHELDSRIDQLCSSFRLHYDNSEYVHFQPYAGVAEALSALLGLGFRLFIVTNKRTLPTKKIIELLEWSCYFEFVYSLDMCGVPKPTKANSLFNLLQSFNLEASRTPYLGDRFDDYKAASSVSMPFFFAEWGYAPSYELHAISELSCLASPFSLMSSSFLHHFL